MNSYFVSPIVDQQNVFYLFSTAAQTIAAFVALILAGYVFIYQAMDNIENKDESKIEVHHQFKIKYYRKIISIVLFTGMTIFLCFIVLWINGLKNSFIKPYLIVFTFIMILITIFQAIIFVIQVIDPNKLKKAAEQILEEEYKKPTEPVDENKFASEFIKLEKNTKDIFSKYQAILIPNGLKISHREDIYIPLREIVKTFHVNELLSHEEYERFIEVIKYRNLVFHGHLEKVDKEMVEETKQMNQIVDRIKLEIDNRLEEE